MSNWLGRGIGLLALTSAFALNAAAGIKVLIASCPGGGDPWNADVLAKIKAAGVFDATTTFDVLNTASTTPTLAQLKGYDAVLVYTDANPANPVAFGNNLADYVDAGGNVVEMIFSFYSGSITGRWESDGYSAIVHGAAGSFGSTSLGTVAIKSHPIMNGVTSFAGGSSSYHLKGTLNANAYRIASWSDGFPLVATRHDKAGHIASLNFYPPSSDARSDFWTASGNAGGKMMANALAFVADHQTDVLLLGAPATAAWLDEVKSTLRAFGRVGGAIDTFNANAGTPTLAQLKKYDAVVVFSDTLFQNANALGDVLADYIDAGGGVVPCAFAFLNGNNIAGRYASGGYSPLIPNSFTAGTPKALGAVAIPGHPIMAGVTSFSGGASSYRCITSLASGATLVASWTDGQPLVATRDNFNGRVAAVNFYPPSSTSRSDFWDITTDGGALLGNALKYAARRDNDVLILGDADSYQYYSDISSKLRATGTIAGKIDFFDTGLGTPSLSLLHRYDSVMLFVAFVQPADQVSLGNALADFVDSGGGIVTTYAATFTAYTPTGRWSSGKYSPLVENTYGYTGTETLGTRYLPNHPVLNRVHSFDNGLSSYHITSVLRPGTVRIADYNDGNVLAAERSTKAGRVVELNFFPASADTPGFTNYWVPSTDGGLLMANALNYVAKSDMSVLLLAMPSSEPGTPADVIAKLNRVGRIRGRTDTFDIHAALPPLGLLSAYDAVLVSSDNAVVSQVALGDNLAAYNDMGYGVVQTTFSNSASYGPTGRWASSGYDPFVYNSPTYIHATLGTVENPASPVMAGVTAFDNGVSGFSDAALVSSGAARICDLSNGFPLAAEKKVSTRQVVGLNFYPESSDSNPYAWNSSTDGGLLMSNALTYVSTTRPCPADFNNDGFVDVYDFNDFVDAFEAGLPSADFNGDGFNDIFDFNDFVDAFEAGC